MRLLLLFIWMYYCYCYEENIALHTVNLAQATYTISNVDEWNCYTCDPSIKLEYIVEHHGAKALQGFDSYTNTIFTAFRGSSNIQNWIDNIQISKISPYNDTSINVEKGFYKAYDYLKPDLYNNMLTLVSKYNTNQLSITGHSLGAAMATLMAYDVLNLYSNYKISFFYQCSFCFGILNCFQRDSTNNTRSQGNSQIFSVFSINKDSLFVSAIVFANYYVLSYVYETPSQVAGGSCSQGCIRSAFPRSVS